MDRCSDFMTQNPICCVGSESVERAAQMMLAEDIGSVPIVDDAHNQKLIGILTDRDIALRIVAEARDAGKTVIREVMSSTPVFCGVDEDVRRVVDLMADGQIRRIPIVDAQRRVVGIIAQGDVATRLDQAETTAHVVKEISRRAVEA